MSVSGEVTRKLLELLLEQAQKVGLDVAGSLLGPAWPLVRPLVMKLLDGLPTRIAGKWRNSEEAFDEMMVELEKEQAQIDLIGKALAANGIDDEWALGMTEQLAGLSDDIFQILCNQAQAMEGVRDVKRGLAELLASARGYRERKPAHIVMRANELEFVDLLRVHKDFLPGYDLTPAGFAPDSVSVRHMPAGFVVWSFSLFNDGDSEAMVHRMELRVAGEGACPAGSRYDQLKPRLDVVEDRVELELGAASYRMFRGKRFGYAPDEFDAFRVQMVFVGEEPPMWQRLQPIVYWSDATGEHATIAPELFLATHPAPQVEQARLKFGLPDA